jgi:Tfp pilus assembly protein PilF
LRDVLSLQDEIVTAITREVGLQLTPHEKTRLSAARTVDPEAYEAYLKGSYHWKKLKPADIDAAESYFTLALDKDPSYAPAHEGLAWVWAARADENLTFR